MDDRSKFAKLFVLLPDPALKFFEITGWLLGNRSNNTLFLEYLVSKWHVPQQHLNLRNKPKKGGLYVADSLTAKMLDNNEASQRSDLIGYLDNQSFW